MVRLAIPRRHKYNAKKTWLDGILFASGAEARRYSELKLLEQGGYINNLQLQPKFQLQPGFKDYTGKRQQAVHYLADFQYIEDGRDIVEDVKGYEKNAVWKMKKKMFLYHYPDLELRVVK